MAIDCRLRIVNEDSLTRVEHPDFSFELPFVWKAVESEQDIELHNKTLPEQLFVKVMLTQSRLSPTSRTDKLRELLASYRRGVQSISGKEADLAEPRFLEGPTECEGRLYGTDHAKGVQMAFVVRVTPTKAVTISIYRYSLDDFGTAFDVYADLIFDFLNLDKA